MLTKRQFFIKYLWFFNLYGNLCFLGVFLCGAGVFAAFEAALTFRAAAQHLRFALLIAFAAALGIGAIAAAVGGVEISGGFKDKFKYYRVTVKRIQKNGFDDELLEDGFDSPCYRLLMRQILRDFGKEKEYRRIKRKLFHRPLIWGNESSVAECAAPEEAHPQAHRR
jgi:hypothetical protein